MANLSIFRRDYVDGCFGEPYIEETHLPSENLKMLIARNTIPSNWQVSHKLSIALQDKLPYRLINIDYPRNAYLRWGDIYFPEPDINIPCEDYWGINGGSVIPTYHGFIISEFAARSKHQSELMSSAFNDLLGIGTYIVPSSRLYTDIDHKMNYIPWCNVFVIDEAYRSENKGSLARMLDNFDVVPSYEPFGPNFAVCEATRKIVTYAADRLTESLRTKGIEVITVPDACTKDIADDGGAHCATNSFHDVGILEYMFGTDWFFDETKF